MIRVASIIPRLRLPRHLSAFDYQLPEGVDAQAGSLVRIRLRSQRCFGVITSVRTVKTPVRPLKTCEVVQPGMRVSPIFLTLLEELRRDFGIGKSLALLTMMPDLPLRSSVPKSIKKTFSPPMTIGSQSGRRLSSSRLRFLTQLRPSLMKHSNVFLLYQSSFEKMVGCAMAMKPFLDAQKQILLLAPTQNAIEEWVAFLKQAFPSADCASLPPPQSKNKAWTLWRRALSGAPLILVGTRRSVFVPLPRLGKIFIDDEESPEHVQWDQNPRYDPRMIARRLAHLARVPVLASGRAPTVSTLLSLNQNKSFLIDLRLPFPKDRLQIIDLEERRREGETGLLSEPLLRAITATLASSQKAFLYFPRKGLARVILCLDCRELLRCPKCSKAVFPRSDHEGTCKTCRTTLGFNKCPACQSPRLFLKGWGLTGLREEVQEHFPQASVEVVQKNNVPRASQSQASIILGTSYAFPMLPWDELGLIAYLLPDVEWNWPDADASHQVFRNLLRFQAEAANTKNSRLIVQTFYPDHPVIQSIRSGEFESFFKQERLQREELGLPPFRQCFRLIFSADHATMAAHKAEELSKVFRFNPRATADFLGPLPRSQTRYRLFVTLPLDAVVDLTTLLPPEIQIEPIFS